MWAGTTHLHQKLCEGREIDSAVNFFIFLKTRAAFVGMYDSVQPFTRFIININRLSTLSGTLFNLLGLVTFYVGSMVKTAVVQKCHNPNWQP